MVRLSNSGELTRFGTITTVATAPINVPATRKKAFERVAPASGCEAI